MRRLTNKCGSASDTVTGGRAGQHAVDPRTFPSVVGLELLISDQIGEYSRGDLQKIAMDIKNGVPHAKEAFHYVYSRMMGWQ